MAERKTTTTTTTTKEPTAAQKRAALARANRRNGKDVTVHLPSWDSIARFVWGLGGITFTVSVALSLAFNIGDVHIHIGDTGGGSRTGSSAGSSAPPPRNVLSPADVSSVAGKHFPMGQVIAALAIAECESGLDASAQRVAQASGGYLAEDSRGLWQINVIGNPRFADWNLWDPDENARAARILYDSSGWDPWVCARKLGYSDKPLPEENR